MTIAFVPTPPASRADAAREMALVQSEIARFTNDASPEQVAARLAADGADPEASEGILLNWLELRFPHLAGMVGVSLTDTDIIISHYGHESFRIMEDLPPVLRQVGDGRWTPAELRLVDLGYFEPEPEYGDSWGDTTDAEHSDAQAYFVRNAGDIF